jgi:hypothetical protein
MLTRSCLLAAAFAAAVLSPSFAQAQDQVKVGSLRCEVAPGIGAIIVSQRDLHCVFTSMSGHRERYAGAVGRFGLDVGATEAGLLTWDVYAPISGRPKGALAGEYGGVGASLTLGAGLGANAMVGGSATTVTLQPVSFETQTGVNVAGGLSTMTLRPMR